MPLLDIEISGMRYITSPANRNAQLQKDRLLPSFPETGGVVRRTGYMEARVKQGPHKTKQSYPTSLHSKTQYPSLLFFFFSLLRYVVE